MAKKPARRVAVIDGVGVSATISLAWRDTDDEVVQEIDWPCDWPEWVDAAFLSSHGYEVVVA